MKLIADYRVARRMKAFSDMIEDGKAWAREHPGEGRPDAWRPDLTPFVMSAGVNLELYDENWAQLRDEYRSVSPSPRGNDLLLSQPRSSSAGPH